MALNTTGKIYIGVQWGKVFENQYSFIQSGQLFNLVDQYLHIKEVAFSTFLKLFSLFLADSNHIVPVRLVPSQVYVILDVFYVLLDHSPL